MNLLMAIGLLFVIEGLTPFLAPQQWRSIVQQMLMQNDNTIRMFGFGSMLIGLVILYLVH